MHKKEEICWTIRFNFAKILSKKREAEKCIEKELIFCKVTAKDNARNEILRIAEIFGAKIIDFSTDTYTMEFCGDSRQVATLLDIVKPLGVKELVRSGKVAITREKQFINLNK